MGFSELLTNWYNCINAFYCHFWDKKTSINLISNILISSNSNINILSVIKNKWARLKYSRFWYITGKKILMIQAYWDGIQSLKIEWASCSRVDKSVLTNTYVEMIPLFI